MKFVSSWTGQGANCLVFLFSLERGYCKYKVILQHSHQLTPPCYSRLFPGIQGHTHTLLTEYCPAMVVNYYHHGCQYKETSQRELFQSCANNRGRVFLPRFVLFSRKNICSLYLCRSPFSISFTQKSYSHNTKVYQVDRNLSLAKEPKKTQNKIYCLKMRGRNDSFYFKSQSFLYLAQFSYSHKNKCVPSLGRQMETQNLQVV